MRERGREGGMRMGGGRGARGTPGRAGPGWVRLGRLAGRKPTTHTTTDRNPIANRNPSEAR
jgi:hypothetical protein